jgi:DNA-binding transcriptional LysR family regulator
MCRQVGGFRPKVIESPTASTLTIDSDWRALLDGAAIALAPEGATRPARVDGIKAVPIEPPPTFILALVWRRDDRSPLLARVVEFMRRYRDEHGWIDGPPLR